MADLGQFRPLRRHFRQARLAPNIGLRQPIPATAPLSVNPNAAQELLRKGHSSSTIMRAGGWKSVNVLARYLDEAEINVWA